MAWGNDRISCDGRFCHLRRHQKPAKPGLNTQLTTIFASVNLVNSSHGRFESPWNITLWVVKLRHMPWNVHYTL
jgi:hypothetical protein